MTHAREILSNTAFLAGSRVIERLANLALALLVAQTLGAAGLGIYAAALAYYHLLATAGELGVTNLLVRELARDPSKTNRYVLHLSVMATAVSAVITVVAVGFLSLASGTLATGVAVVALAVSPGILNTIQEAVFVAHQRVALQTYTTFGAGVLNLAATALLLARGYGVVSLLVSFVVIRYLVTLCYFILINRFICRLRWEFRLATARALVGELKTFTALSVLGALFTRPEIIILSLIASDAQVGYYSAALKVIDIWYFIPQTLMVNVFPVLSRSYHAVDRRAQAIQDTAMKYLLAVVLPLSVGTAVAARPIVELLYGQGFDPAVVVLRLLSLNLILYSFHSLFWRVLAARGQQGKVLEVQLVTIVPRLAGGYALISWLGSLGAAISMPLNLLFHTGLLGFQVRKDGTRIRGLRLAWRFAVAAGGIGVFIWFATLYLPILAVAPLGAVMYLVFALGVGAFSLEDYARLRGSLRSAGARQADA